MAPTQLSFTLRTSSNVQTVHLLGSWDNYAGQLPLSQDRSKAGAWKGHFRFQSATLQPGQRYWYYYIMDGYHVSHDPAKPSTVEPTTRRTLNILDVPAHVTSTTSSAPRRRGPAMSVSIPTGRGLSPSRIAHPKPSKPYASRAVREADYSRSPIDAMDDLASGLERASLFSPAGNAASPTSSVGGSSLSSRSSARSSPQSLSSLSDTSSRCSCRRYGITRRGDKVLLDCGGSRCGYASSSSGDDSSSCSSDAASDSDSDSGSDIDSDPEPQVRRTVVKPRIQTVAPRRVTQAANARRR